MSVEYVRAHRAECVRAACCVAADTAATASPQAYAAWLRARPTRPRKAAADFARLPAPAARSLNTKRGRAF